MLSENNKWSLESAIIYICAILVLAAGLAACLLRGFYFTEEMYPFLTVWFVLCSVVAICLLFMRGRGKGRGRREQRIGEQRAGEVGVGVTYIMLCCPLVILFLYAVTWLRGPLSGHETMNEILRWGFYASFFLLVYYVASNRRGARILMVSWSILGMSLSLSALLAVCGLLKLPFAVAYSNTTEVSVTGARLGGLLEYPNTFGAVMAVFLVERLYAAATYYARTDTCSRGVERGEAEKMSEVRSEIGAEVERGEAEKMSEVRCEIGAEVERGKAGTTAAALLRLLPLFPYAAALLLSESRGAWLAAACACAAALAWKRQLIAPLLVAGAAPMAAAALLYRQLARAGLAVEPLPGLLTLAGLWAGALLAGLWMCRRERSAAGNTRAAMVVLTAAGWTAAGTAVLLHVRERITGPSSTVSARGLFYRDAWRLAAEAPWLGRGGETWRNSYLAIQSRPYVGSQVHNGYLDILLNLGIVGLAAILLMLLAAGWLMATTSPRHFPPFLVIILHSAVDFDWSYGIVWLLMFWLPALATGVRSTATDLLLDVRPTATDLLPDVRPAPANPPTVDRHPSAPSTIDRALTHVRFHTNQWFVAVACGVCLILGLMSFRAEQGAVIYQKALQTSEPVEKKALLQQSLAWNPLSPQTGIVLSRILPDEQSVSVIRGSLKYSPKNASLSWEMAVRLMSGDNSGEALYWIRRSIRLDVYNKVKRVKAIEGMLTMSQRKIAAGNYTEGLKCADSGEELLRQYRLLAAREVTQGKRYNDRRFEITKQADDLLSQRLKDMKLMANYMGEEARLANVHALRTPNK